MATQKRINLALQGGGAHGAFTWGVLDRLLQEDSLKLEGICGTSSGAMNATVMAYGLQIGGREEARKRLRAFWQQMSERGYFAFLQPSWLDVLKGEPGNLDFSPMYNLGRMVSLFASPYQFNPSNYNPLRKLLLDFVDFSVLQKKEGAQIYVCATNVKSGKPRVFTQNELSVEAVLASSCVPRMYKSIEIEGEFYWDGGFMGNPPLYPLIHNSQQKKPDILIVHINPINIPTVPSNPEAIRDRESELSFNSSLMIEVRNIEFLNDLVKKGNDCDGQLKQVHIHSINPERDIWALNNSSKMNITWEFLTWLHNWGRKYASQWVEQHLQTVGKASSCNVRELFF